MLRFHSGFYAAVILLLLAIALPAQAAINFLEDFEGAPTPPGTIDALGWGQNGGSVLYDSGVGLSTNVAHAPASNTSTTKFFSGSLEDKTVVTADMYLVGVYDTEGGEGMVGIDDGTASWLNTLLVGPNANPTNPGYPIDAGGWLAWDGLNDGGRINITTGGAPGVGPQFKGIGSGRVQVKLTIDQPAATVSVDIIDLVDGAALNPTWVIPLTSGGLSKLANINSVMMAWNDVHPGDTREIDNIRVASGLVAPEPTQTWATDNSADWSVAGNWSPPGAPDSNTVVAGFGDLITSPRTVSTNVAVTVNGIVFGIPNASQVQQSYTVAGPGSVALAPNASIAPSIFVLEGSHQFQTAALNFSDSAEVGIATGASLALDNVVNLNGNTLTKIGDGRLNINQQVNTGGGSVVVAAGVTGGNGTIHGHFTNSGAVVVPGDGIGKLSVVGDYYQSAGSLRVEIGGTTSESQYDVLHVTGDLTISGGQLDVALNFTPGVGDSFDILNFNTADLSGATLNLDTLPANLAWDSSQLAVDGSLSVVSLEPTFRWTADASGEWDKPSNWAPSFPADTFPNSNVEIAVFDSQITLPRTVVTDEAVSVKDITFGDTNTSTHQQSYNIAGSGSVNLVSETNTSTVRILEGAHEFQAVVGLGNATILDAAASTSLVFNNGLNLNGNQLTKIGPGTMVVNNDLSTSDGSVVLATGTLEGNGTVGGDLANNGGTVAPGSSSNMATGQASYGASSFSAANSGITVPEPSSQLVALFAASAVWIRRRRLFPREPGDNSG